MKRIIARLLHLANARPPFMCRERFYSLKDRLLKRWGTREGYDLQRIDYACWGYGDAGCTGMTCTKCGGTGIYDVRKTYLDRWTFGGFPFHTISDAQYRQHVEPPTITGRIKHTDYGRWSDEAALWLFLIFDRQSFWKLMTACKPYAWQWLPLSFLQRNIGWPLGRLMGRLESRRCHCGRRYRIWFASLGWCVCPRCRTPKPVPTCDDIPF